MGAEAISNQILTIRDRLAEIKRQRELLPAGAFSERTDLIDEEHELQARLGELQGSWLSDGDTEELDDVPGSPRI
jgi:hypothetical protein